ncbi:hypothetical protein [Membranihabitans marinus]|uniref:hypothetical protein n=1 Tax=Membranihabitans marinus TaxID=1227546 RepID=UPI001F1D2F04|nr:hypothetical protein [Membranihabitans marinus]
MNRIVKFGGKFFAATMALVLVSQAITFFYLTLNVSNNSNNTEFVFLIADEEVEELNLFASLLAAEEELLHDYVDLEAPAYVSGKILSSNFFDFSPFCEFVTQVLLPPPEYIG